MRISFSTISKALALSAMLAVAAASARADSVLWQNASNGQDTGAYNANMPSQDAPGWIVSDNFLVNGQKTITGFSTTDWLGTTTVSYPPPPNQGGGDNDNDGDGGGGGGSGNPIFTFTPGSISDYKSTTWYLWGPNSGDPFGAPTFTGTSTFSAVQNSNGSYTFSLTGLDLPVTGGQWFLGFSFNLNPLDPNDLTSAVSSSSAALPGYWQQSTDGAYQFDADTASNPLTGNTAFTVYSTPEPGTLTLLGAELLVLAGVLRLKLLR